METVSDEGYIAHVENNIFQPLEMQDSYLSKNDGKDGGMSEGHLKWFSFPVATDIQYLDNSLAAGFIISSAEDMSHHLLMHLGEGSYKQSMLLSEIGAAELHTPGQVADGKSEYAMGVADIIQGISPETDSRTWKMVYLCLLILMIILIAFTVRPIILLPKKWIAKIRKNRPRGFFPVFGRIVLPTGLELLIPYLIFIFIPAVAGFSIWSLFTLFHPDLVYSILLLSALMLIKALWRIYLFFRIRSN